MSPWIERETPAALAWVEAGAPAVRLTRDLAPAEALAAINPRVLIIGRGPEVVSLDESLRQGEAPDAAARRQVAAGAALRARFPAITHWEGPAPPTLGPAHDPEALRRMAWYATFEASRVGALAGAGARAVIGGFASGQPDLGLWSAFIPALDAAEQNGGLLGVHEHEQPTLWARAGQHGAAVLRHRRVVERVLTPNGLEHLPLVILSVGVGESGDWQTQLPVWHTLDGQQDPRPYWRGSSREPERYFIEQLMWYEDQLDARVVAACVRIAGQVASDRELAATLGGQVIVRHLRAAHSQMTRRVNPDLEPAPRPRAITIPPGPEPARHTRENVLDSQAFAAGCAYFLDETDEIMIPAGWEAGFADAQAARPAGQALAFTRPFTALINGDALPALDRERVLHHGPLVWKVAGVGAPFHLWLMQTVTGLPPGMMYELDLALLAELPVRARPQPAYASEAEVSELGLQLSVGRPGPPRADAWRPLATGRRGAYRQFKLRAPAVEGALTVRIDLRCRYPLPQAAWYLADVRLTPVAE